MNCKNMCPVPVHRIYKVKFVSVEFCGARSQKRPLLVVLTLYSGRQGLRRSFILSTLMYRIRSPLEEINFTYLLR